MALDHHLADVDVTEYRAALLSAAELAPHVVQPPALAEAVTLWLAASAERAQGWRTLLGRAVVAEWNAARAVLDSPEAL